MRLVHLSKSSSLRCALPSTRQQPFQQRLCRPFGISQPVLIDHPYHLRANKLTSRYQHPHLPAFSLHLRFHPLLKTPCIRILRSATIKPPPSRSFIPMLSSCAALPFNFTACISIVGSTRLAGAMRFGAGVLEGAKIVSKQDTRRRMLLHRVEEEATKGL